MERRLVIHGSFMGGYGLPGLLAFVGIIGVIQAVLNRIWARPAALVVWLILIGGAVVVILVAEGISRRNVREVSGGRIRWSFRQPPEQGDQALSSLQKVEVFSSAARLVFEDSLVVASRAVFRRRDINRLVEALRELGAQVTGGGLTWQSIRNQEAPATEPHLA